MARGDEEKDLQIDQIPGPGGIGAARDEYEDRPQNRRDKKNTTTASTDRERKEEVEKRTKEGLARIGDGGKYSASNPGSRSINEKMREGTGSALQDLLMNNGLSVVTPGRGGITPELEDWERGVTVVDENGNRINVRPSDVDIGDPQSWADYVNDLYMYEFPQLDLAKDVLERYSLATGNTTELNRIYDKDSDDGYSDGWRTDVIASDNYNVNFRAMQTVATLAAAFDKKYGTGKSAPRGTINYATSPHLAGYERPEVYSFTDAEKAEYMLDQAGIPKKTADLRKALLDGAGGRGGAPTRVETVNEMSGDSIRGRYSDTAMSTIGRTLGVGEANRLAKTLNKQARKDPDVRSGIGSSRQTQKSGFDYEQGLQDELLKSADGKAYQRAVSGINLLGEILRGDQ